MTLHDYLTSNKITEATFAALIGISQSRVNRIRRGENASASTIRRITEATKGKVTANDLFRTVEAAE